MRLEPISYRMARASDWPTIRALLHANKLPTDGAEAHLANFIVAESSDELTGCIGLEQFGETGLLRSCAVAAEWRGSGVGGALVQHLIQHARQRGMHELVLLTTTASDYFPRFGFAQFPRNDAAQALLASAEFQGACPASAVAMRQTLQPA